MAAAGADLKTQLFIEETKELLDATLAEMRELLADEGAARGLDMGEAAAARRDDKYLLMFLRGRKFNPQRAFKVLCNYENAIRTRGYETVGDEDFEDLMRLGLMELCEDQRDEDGRAIFFFDTAKYNDAIQYCEDTDRWLRCCWAYFSALTDDEQTQQRGVTAVISGHGFSVPWGKIGVVARMEREISEMFQEQMPIRVGKIVVTRENWLFDVFWGIIKWFLKEKLRQRTAFVGDDMDALFALVPREKIPKAWGGECETKYVSPIDDDSAAAAAASEAPSEAEAAEAVAAAAAAAAVAAGAVVDADGKPAAVEAVDEKPAAVEAVDEKPAAVEAVEAVEAVDEKPAAVEAVEAVDEKPAAVEAVEAVDEKPAAEEVEAADVKPVGAPADEKPVEAQGAAPHAE